MDRMFVLCSLGSGGQLTASYVALCERCTMMDGEATLRCYRAVAEMGAQLKEVCSGDPATSLVCHHDGVEVRYTDDSSLKQLAFLPWKCRVDYTTCKDIGYRWH
jgi:hypothetical protein